MHSQKAAAASAFPAELPPELPPDLYEDLRRRWDRAESDHQRCWVLMDVMYHFDGVSRHDAIRWAHRGLDFSVQAGDQLMSARFMLSLANLHAAAGHAERGFLLLQQAFPLIRSDTYPVKQDLYDLLNARAALRLSLGDEGGARNDMLAVLNESDAAIDDETRLVTRQHLVNLSLELEQPEAALHHLEHAARQLEALTHAAEAQGQPLAHAEYYGNWNMHYHAHALLQRGEQLLLGGHPALADEILTRAEAACEALRGRAGTSGTAQLRQWAAAHASQLALLRGRLEDAGRHAWKALEASEELGEHDAPTAQIALARWYAANGDWSEAARFIRQALPQAHTSGRRRLVQALLADLAQIHERQGDVTEALSVTREALAHARETLRNIDRVYALVEAAPEPPPPAPTEETLSWQDHVQQQERLAQVDPLTGALNAHGLREKAEGLALGSRVVAVLDIDHFRAINERHSHAVGDQVLVAVAEVLGGVRPGTLLARQGGDQFVLVALVADAAAAARLLRRCQAAVQAYPWHTLLPARQVTVTGGYTVTRDDDLDGALAVATRWMLKAKSAGRGRLLPSA